MVAALVGLLLDPDEYDPTFPLSTERPEDALARARPPLVLLLDCNLDVAHSDLFFARSAKTRATIVLFGPPGSRENVDGMSRTRDIPCVHLPTSRAALTEAVEAAISSAITSGIWSIAAALLTGALSLTRFPAVS